jgi:hypothetical protein
MGRARPVFDPDPKTDPNKGPTPEQVQEGFRRDAAELLPPYLDNIERQQGLACTCSDDPNCLLHTVVRS